MIDRPGLSGEQMVRLFALWNAGQLPAAWAALLQRFQVLASVSEVEGLARDVQDLLWALKTGHIVPDADLVTMTEEARLAEAAALKRLAVQP